MPLENAISEYKSDYGSISVELCDKDLRQRVVAAVGDARNTESNNLALENIDDIAAYINRLEDALLRHHAGTLKQDEILDHLKNCAGLDIRALAFSLEAMYAEDA